MKKLQGLSLFARRAAFLLCTLLQTTSSLTTTPSQVTSSQVSSRGRSDRPVEFKHQINNSLRRRPAPKIKEALLHVTSVPVNTSKDNTVISERSHGAHWSPEEGVSPLCAYRVIEGGITGQLCFRHTLPEYKCHGECRRVVSFGSLVASILINGSVLLQWAQGGESMINGQDEKTNRHNISKDPGTNITSSGSGFSGRRHRRGGFELSCWWNGSYTQFECAGVQLARGCRDYLLTELHENIPYRICLRSLNRSHRPERDCVEFTLPPSGMQDIVIAMTTVGGAICVMLVIICLLVAYITENIMSPSTAHAHPYRTHSRH